MSEGTTVLQQLGISRAVAGMQFRLLLRHPAESVVVVFQALLVGGLPLLLGAAVQGGLQANVFARNTGTSSYVPYMLIGSSVLAMLNAVLLSLGVWAQREREQGTLESLYLIPGTRLWILLGIGLYGTAWSVGTSIVSYVAGCLVFRVDPFAGNIPLALVFLALGTVAMYGLGVLFAGMVLRLEDPNPPVMIALWTLGLLMGVFFPLKVLPGPLQWLALLFPLSWMVNGLRAALLGAPWVTSWSGDLAILALLSMAACVVGYAWFRRVEVSMQRNQGIGTY